MLWLWKLTLWSLCISSECCFSSFEVSKFERLQSTLGYALVYMFLQIWRPGGGQETTFPWINCTTNESICEDWMNLYILVPSYVWDIDELSVPVSLFFSFTMQKTTTFNSNILGRHWIWSSSVTGWYRHVVEYLFYSGCKVMQLR